MYIKAEWDSLKEVWMHEPGVEIDCAMLTPRAFLFERAFNRKKGIIEHENLRAILKENGVQVRLLRDIVKENDEKLRISLEGILRDKGIFMEAKNRKAYRDEMSKNLKNVDIETVLNLLLFDPRLNVMEDAETNMQYPDGFLIRPLTNLYFMRDQQIVGSSGVLSLNLKLPQRANETELMYNIAKEILGNEDVKKLNSGYLEGGDYIPCDKFGLIGVGSRSNMEGALSAMNSGIFEHEEVLVVENPKYDFMKNDFLNNMHLDTYFNIASKNTVICSVYLAKRANGKIYKRNGEIYEMEGETDLYSYMNEKQFNFIDLSIEEQLSYSSNFLTVSDGKIIGIDSRKVYKRLREQGILTSNIVKGENEEHMFPYRKDLTENGVDCINVDLQELTGGYGGAHCMTMALRRK
ncbi:arginine deiminase family protein [Caldiplasma sukawensis]